MWRTIADESECQEDRAVVGSITRQSVNNSLVGITHRTRSRAIDSNVLIVCAGETSVSGQQNEFRQDLIAATDLCARNDCARASSSRTSARGQEECRSTACPRSRSWRSFAANQILPTKCPRDCDRSTSWFARPWCTRGARGNERLNLID